MKVKICGIRTVEDAKVAAEEGADFIGLVFVPKRRRRLDLGPAQELVRAFKESYPHHPKIVGLFADQPLEEVNHYIESCGLDLAQLCGAESLEYCAETKCSVIKVIHVPGSAADSRNDGDLTQRVENYRAAGNLVTLDRLVEGLQGGTGQGFDWGIAAGLSKTGHSFILAGGLSPENVGQAIATAGPWGVDVSSGVETNGDKDHQKIREFMRNARQASEAIEN